MSRLDRLLSGADVLGDGPELSSRGDGVEKQSKCDCNDDQFVHEVIPVLDDVSDKERAGPAFLQLAFPWQRGNLLRRSSDETIENQRFHRDSEGPARQRND